LITLIRHNTARAARPAKVFYFAFLLVLAGQLLPGIPEGAAQSPLQSITETVNPPRAPETTPAISTLPPEPGREEIIACLADAEAVKKAVEEADNAVKLWNGRREQAASQLEMPPEGVSAELVQNRMAVIDEAVGAWQRRQQVLSLLRELREKNQTQRVVLDAFNGIEDPPPYTLQFCDQFFRTVEAQRISLEAEQVALDTAWGYLESIRRERPLLDASVNRAAEQLRQSQESGRAAAAFALETARLALDALNARLKEAEALVCRAAARRDLAETEYTLAARRAEWVEQRTLYRREELENRQKAESGALQSLEKERVKTRRELEKRQSETAAARREADRDAGAQPRLERALQREQSAIEMLDILNELITLETVYTDLLKRRLAAMNASLARELQLELTLPEWLEYFRQQRQRYDSLRDSEQQRLAAMQTELNGWESTLSGESAAQSSPSGIMVPLLRERIPLLDRLVSRYGDLAFMAKRGADQAQQRLADRGIPEQLAAAVQYARKHIGVWLDYSLLTAGDIPITPRKLLAAAVILVIGLVLVRLVMGRLRAGLFQRMKERSHGAYVAETLLHYALILLVFYTTLRYLNIPLTVFAFLGGAVAIGVGFGAQNLISNFLSGLILMGEQQVRLNDIVEVDGLIGRVTHIGARASTIQTFNGVDVLVPNSKFLENNVVNWTLTTNKLRFEITVGAAYGADPNQVIEILEQAAASHGKVLKDPPPLAVLHDFGDNALLFTLYLWVDVNSADSRVVRSDLRRKIYKDFNRMGIEIAFPQMDVHLRDVPEGFLRTAKRAESEDSDRKEETPQEKTLGERGKAP